MIGICDFCKKELYLKIGCNNTKICPECSLARRDGLCEYCGKSFSPRNLCGYHNLPICNNCNKCAKCLQQIKTIQSDINKAHQRVMKN